MAISTDLLWQAAGSGLVQICSGKCCAPLVRIILDKEGGALGYLITLTVPGTLGATLHHFL